MSFNERDDDDGGREEKKEKETSNQMERYIDKHVIIDLRVRFVRFNGDFSMTNYFHACSSVFQSFNRTLFDICIGKHFPRLELINI